MRRNKFDIIRGSSGKKGVRSLIRIIKRLKEGYTFGTAVDGPRGPAYKIKPGMLYVAEKSGVEIIPVGVAFDKKWIFEKSWDKMQIPKPFSKAVIYFGKPIKVTKENNNEELENYINNEINKINEEALNVLNYRGGFDE